MSISRLVTEKLQEYTTASWTPEQELTLPPPREVVFRRPVKFIGALMLGVAIVVATLSLRPAIQHSYLMWRGAPVTGSVLQKYQTESRTKSEKIYHYHLNVQYAAGGVMQMGRVEVTPRYYASMSVSQPIPMHYDGRKPPAFTLDDDALPIPWQTLIPLGLLVVLGYAFNSIKKTGENGVAVKGLVIRSPGRGWVGKGFLKVYYEFGNSAFMGAYVPNRQRGGGKQAGETLSLLINPDKPRHYMPYPMPEIEIRS